MSQLPSQPLPRHLGRELAMPELELPMRYGMNYDWGTIQVTEDAHEAYGLVPLTPTVNDRSELQETKLSGTPLIRVAVVAPHELPVPPEDGLIWTSRAQSGPEIGIVAGLGMDLPRTKELYKDTLVEQLKPFLGDELSHDEILDRIVTPEDIPFADTIDMQTTSQIAHQLSGAISDETHDAVKEWVQYYDNLSIKQRISLLGGVGITSTFAPLLMLTALEVPLQPASLAFPAATALTTALLSSRSLSRWLREQPIRQAGFSSYATSVAQKVGDGFHEAYCSSHFDTQFEQAVAED